MVEKKVLILFRRAPYGSLYTAEGLRTAIGLLTFEAQVGLALVGDGVFWALGNNQPGYFGMKPLDQALITLQNEYELKGLYIEIDSLQERGLDPDIIRGSFSKIKRPDLAEIIQKYDVILPF